MSFLNPILLFGLGAVAVPILIHLLNRRRFQRVVWGAMRFLRVSVERNRRRMLLEDWILLALRCLLLALLALGLARPALQSDSTALLGEAKVTGILILDASYSMGVSDGAATRFEKAKNAAEEILDGLPAGSALAVWLAGESYQGIVPEPTFDLNLARESIREASLTDRGTDLFPSLGAAVESLRSRLTGRREVYLITDGQSAGWRQLNEIRDVVGRAREIGVHVILIEDGERQNVSLSDLRLAGGLAPVGEPVRFEARIHNHGDEEIRDLRVSISVDGQQAEDAVVVDRLPAGGGRTVALFAKLPTPGYHDVTASIDADRLPADDRRTLAVRGAREVRVLLVDGEPGSEAREWETFFLSHALAPVAPEQRAGYFIQTTRATTPDLGSVRLDDFDAVILANVPDLSEAVAGAFENYLRRGGGLIVFAGERVNPAFYNRRLFEANRILPAALGPAVGDATQETNFVTLAAGNYDHPITELWNDPAAGTLASARFYRWIRLIPAGDETVPGAENEGGAPTDTAGSPYPWSEPARVVARYTDGTAAIMERSWGLGRVVLVGSTADTEWNDFAVRPAFVPLMHRILGAILARQDSGLNVRVGEGFLRRMPSEYLDKDALVRPPGAAETLGELRRVELIGGWPALQFNQTDRAGLYRVEVADPPLQLKFAAQADPVESNLEPMTPAQAEALEGLAEVTQWDAGIDLRDRLTRMRSGVELWWLVLVAVIGLAIIESGLAQWFSRSK